MKTKPKTLTGSITICRTSSNGKEGDYISLCVEDEVSHVEFLSAQIGLAEFTLALTARGNVPIKFELRGAHLVGMKHEHKTEVVPFAPTSAAIAKDREGLDDHERSPLVNKALAPFEVDGWKGDSSDLFNLHRCVRDAKVRSYTVNFHRHVMP